MARKEDKPPWTRQQLAGNSPNATASSAFVSDWLKGDDNCGTFFNYHFRSLRKIYVLMERQTQRVPLRQRIINKDSTGRSLWVKT